MPTLQARGVRFLRRVWSRSFGVLGYGRSPLSCLVAPLSRRSRQAVFSDRLALRSLPACVVCACGFLTRAGQPLPLSGTTMAIAESLVKNHAKIARVLFPTAVGFGFIYTVKVGRSPLNDASAVARGTFGPRSQTADTPACIPLGLSRTILLKMSRIFQSCEFLFSLLDFCP
jgi:hypothetical protein